MQRPREKNSKIFCSSMNSDISVAPDWDANFTPIQRTVPVKITPSKKNESLRKENLKPQDFYKYTKYLQSLYTSTLMNDRFLEEKSQIEGCLVSLSEELEMRRNMLEKASKYLKDISYCAEKEAALKSQSNTIEDILNVLENIHLQDSVSITNKLNTVRHTVPTRDIKVCQDSSEVVEFRRIMDGILTRWRTIRETLHPYADSYSQAEKLLHSIIETQEVIASDVQDALNVKSAAQEKLLLRYSQWKSILLLKELEGGDGYVLRIQKQLAEELKELDGNK